MLVMFYTYQRMGAASRLTCKKQMNTTNRKADFVARKVINLSTARLLFLDR